MTAWGFPPNTTFNSPGTELTEIPEVQSDIDSPMGTPEESNIGTLKSSRSTVMPRPVLAFTMTTNWRPYFRRLALNAAQL